MKKALFEIEFNRKCGNSGLVCTATKDANVYILSNDKRAFLIRTETPKKLGLGEHKRFPAPHYHAQAVEMFKFKVDDTNYPPDYFVFMYENPVLKKHCFLILKTDQLSERLKSLHVTPDELSFYTMLVWVLPDNFVFVANNLSAEGEWYLLGSDLGKDTERDISNYLNQWKFF